MKNLLKTLKALADGNRLRIILLLLDQPRCVCELQAALEISQPSVSKHLRILEEAGWLKKTRQGQFIEYQLAAFADPGDQRASMLVLITPWLRADPEFEILSRRAGRINRYQLCRPEAKASSATAPVGNAVRAASRSENG